MSKDEIKEMINECMRELVGDTPIPCQLDVALKDKANTTEQINLEMELNALKKEVQRLSELVGDTSVTEQINAAFSK